MDLNYYNKYIKYKNKYLGLKKKIELSGGNDNNLLIEYYFENFNIENENQHYIDLDDIIFNEINSTNSNPKTVLYKEPRLKKVLEASATNIINEILIKPITPSSSSSSSSSSRLLDYFFKYYHEYFDEIIKDGDENYHCPIIFKGGNLIKYYIIDAYKKKNIQSNFSSSEQVNLANYLSETLHICLDYSTILNTYSDFDFVCYCIPKNSENDLEIETYNDVIQRLIRQTHLMRINLINMLKTKHLIRQYILECISQNEELLNRLNFFYFLQKIHKRGDNIDVENLIQEIYDYLCNNNKEQITFNYNLYPDFIIKNTIEGGGKRDEEGEEEEEGRRKKRGMSTQNIINSNKQKRQRKVIYISDEEDILDQINNLFGYEYIDVYNYIFAIQGNNTYIEDTINILEKIKILKEEEEPNIFATEYKNIIGLSYNNIILTPTTDFDLIRLKLSFSAMNRDLEKQIITSELFDLSVIRPRHAQFHSSKQKYHDHYGLTNINRLNEDLNIINHQINNDDGTIINKNLLVFSISATLSDIINILFKQDIYPWEDQKYKKRLTRLGILLVLNINEIKSKQEIYEAEKKEEMKVEGEEVVEEAEEKGGEEVVEEAEKKEEMKVEGEEVGEFLSLLRTNKSYKDYILGLDVSSIINNLLCLKNTINILLLGNEDNPKSQHHHRFRITSDRLNKFLNQCSGLHPTENSLFSYQFVTKDITTNNYKLKKNYKLKDLIQDLIDNQQDILMNIYHYNYIYNYILMLYINIYISYNYFWTKEQTRNPSIIDEYEIISNDYNNFLRGLRKSISVAIIFLLDNNKPIDLELLTHCNDLTANYEQKANTGEDITDIDEELNNLFQAFLPEQNKSNVGIMRSYSDTVNEVSTRLEEISNHNT